MKKILPILREQINQEKEITPIQEKELFESVIKIDYKKTEMLFLLGEIESIFLTIVEEDKRLDSTAAEKNFTYLGIIIGLAMAKQWIDDENVTYYITNIQKLKLKKTFFLTAFELIASKNNPFWEIYLKDATMN